MARRSFFQLPTRRRLIVLGALIIAGPSGWFLWQPGATVTDGRHDRRHNGLWLQHGWLADDGWFIRNGKEDRMNQLRDPAALAAQVELCRRHHITDLFPHLCPANSDGALPAVDDAQVERFLGAFAAPEFRVMPWVGGAYESGAGPSDANWRNAFVVSIADLMARHPRLAGVHVNIEPCPSGHAGLLNLLEELRPVFPTGKLISVAAYPPPTILHRFPDVHWEEGYFRQVATRCDQMVVMMYDTSIRTPKLYRNLMRSWTREVISWAGDKQVLLGLPTYDDADSGDHDPSVENLMNALSGVHAGLMSFPTMPPSYQGVAIYCDWEMTSDEWQTFRENFL